MNHYPDWVSAIPALAAQQLADWLQAVLLAMTVLCKDFVLDHYSIEATAYP